MHDSLFSIKLIKYAKLFISINTKNMWSVFGVIEEEEIIAKKKCFVSVKTSRSLFFNLCIQF